ncbi:MAG: hypothetical protein J5842_03765, partial [Lachnospiraceae bacterium]|nr:hypothetical protein [Lachnospiraceae bacterium]
MPKGKKTEKQESKVSGLEKMLSDLRGKKLSLESAMNENKDNEAEYARLAAELSTVENQIVYINSKLKEAADELEKVKQQEEKKEEEEKKINNIKGAIVAERAEIISQMELGNKDAGLERNSLVAEGIEPAQIEQIFSDNTFLHVTPDMVSKILENEEFQEDHFSTKLHHQEIEANNEYKTVVWSELHRASIKATGNIKDDERLFYERMKETNGFKIAEKKLQNKRSVMEGREDDLKDFVEIKELLDRVYEKTTQAEKKFLKSGNKCPRDNGYKADMIALEQELCSKVTAFHKKLLKRVEPDEDGKVNDEDAHGTMKKYAVMKEITFDIERQLKIDKCLEKNNAVREKMEMWYIYEKIKGKQPGSVREIKNMIRGEEKAWEKPQKIKKQALGKGQAVEFSADYALIETQMLLDRINEHKAFSDAERKRAKECIAALVLHELIKSEVKAKKPQDKPY